MPIHNQFIRDADKEPYPTGLKIVGAYLPVEIHVPPEIAEVLTDKGEALPVPQVGVALIDTGATGTCVEESILAQLGLNPIRKTMMGTANGPVERNVYPARITFPTKG